MKEINVTISLYFEVKDAEIFGGTGEEKPMRLR